MGSSSSTTVNPVKNEKPIQSSKAEDEKSNVGKPKQERVLDSDHTSNVGLNNNSLLESMTEQNDSEDQRNTAVHAELEKQIGCLESEKLDLVEQLTTLEEQLEAYAKQAKQATIYEADESIADDHAKDEQIEQLQTENEALKAEVKKLRRHYKKRLRLLNTQTTELKHQHSLEKFELKDEIARLIEENTQLINKMMQRGSDGKLDNHTTQVSDSDSAKHRVILDLSAKLAEQETMIATLQQQLQGTSDEPLQEKTPGLNTRKNDTSQLHFQQLSYTGSGDDVDDLNAIANEIRQLQLKKKKKRSPTQPKWDRDYRESSGVSRTSRDSGVVSMETEIGPKASRVSSATSTLSALSYDDELDDPYTQTSDRKTPIDPASIRQISAHKNKKKHDDDLAYFDSLLNDNKLDSFSSKKSPLSKPIQV